MRAWSYSFALSWALEPPNHAPSPTSPSSPKIVQFPCLLPFWRMLNLRSSAAPLHFSQNDRHLEKRRGLDMREKKTIWQIGILVRKLCTSLIQHGYFVSSNTERLWGFFSAWNGTLLLLVFIPLSMASDLNVEHEQGFRVAKSSTQETFQNGKMCMFSGPERPLAQKRAKNEEATQIGSSLGWISGSLVRTSRVKNFGQASKPWENRPLGVDIYDLNTWTSTTSGGFKKLWAFLPPTWGGLQAKRRLWNLARSTRMLACTESGADDSMWVVQSRLGNAHWGRARQSCLGSPRRSGCSDHRGAGVPEVLLCTSYLAALACGWFSFIVFTV